MADVNTTTVAKIITNFQERFRITVNPRATPAMKNTKLSEVCSPEPGSARTPPSRIENPINNPIKPEEKVANSGLKVERVTDLAAGILHLTFY